MVTRLRHFRGHGVHSPYVYNIVREVFMRRTLIPTDNSELYGILSGLVNNTIAIELQNIATLCGYHNYAIDPQEICNGDVFVIITSATPLTKSQELLNQATTNGVTIALLKRKERNEFERIEDDGHRSHKSTLIAKRSYLLFFNNHLPKQRYIL